MPHAADPGREHHEHRRRDRTVRHDAGTEESLDLLAAAAAQLEDSTDALLGHFVDCCRRDGRCWPEIGTALAVARQAVHSRFASAVAAHLFAASPSPTFDQFTERAGHVVAAASQAAAATGQETVTTVHFLLGVFSELDGLAGRALGCDECQRAERPCCHLASARRDRRRRGRR